MEFQRTILVRCDTGEGARHLLEILAMFEIPVLIKADYGRHELAPDYFEIWHNETVATATVIIEYINSFNKLDLFVYRPRKIKKRLKIKLQGSYP